MRIKSHPWPSAVMGITSCGGPAKGQDGYIGPVRCGCIASMCFCAWKLWLLRERMEQHRSIRQTYQTYNIS